MEVKNYLISLGIDEAVMTVKSFSENCPYQNNADNNINSRRVVIRVK